MNSFGPSRILHSLRKLRNIVGTLTHLIMLPTLMLGDQTLYAVPVPVTQDLVTQIADFAALNVGQLKNLARKARNDMEVRLATEGGAGTAVNDLIASWGTTSENTSDYSVVVLGQVKAVAKPFYDRLLAVKQITALPAWLSTSDDADNGSIVTVGQVRNAFDLPLQESQLAGAGVQNAPPVAALPIVPTSTVYPAGIPPGAPLAEILGPVTSYTNGRGEFLSGHSVSTSLPSSAWGRTALRTSVCLLPCRRAPLGWSPRLRLVIPQAVGTAHWA